MEQSLWRNSYVCHATTYAKSYLVRARQKWNTLPQEMRMDNVTIRTFKSILKQYYKTELSSLYDREDARAWKTV